MKNRSENPITRAYRLTAEDPDSLTQADVLRAIEYGNLPVEVGILPNDTLEEQDAKRMGRAFRRRHVSPCT